jgi:hypothetical protein
MGMNHIKIIYGQLFSTPDLTDNANNTAIQCCGTVRKKSERNTNEFCTL